MKLGLSIISIYHAFSYYDTQNSIVIASVRTQSRKTYLMLGGKSVALVTRNFFLQLRKHQL
jgi:hypothetical protein